MSVGDAVIAWIECYCLVPEGRDVGVPVVLREWQREIVRACFNDPLPRRVIASFGRKNGKTALSGMILLAAIASDEVSRRNSQVYSVARSRDQAAIVFELMRKMIQMNPELHAACRVTPSGKSIDCPGTGVHYQALSADSTTAMGKSPVLCLHDELGLVTAATDDLYEAMETAAGAHENPLSIVISTQAPTDGALLSQLIDDGLANPEGSTRVFLHTAPDDLDPFSEEAWYAANPALGDFLQLGDMQEAAGRAQRLPAARPSYENLKLNRRVSAEPLLITAQMWRGAERGVDLDALEGRSAFLGLDLSSHSDLTSLALVVPEGPQAHGWIWSWVAADSLGELGEKWDAPYRSWVEGGHLLPSGSATVDFRDVADVLEELDRRFHVVRAATDPHAFRDLVTILNEREVFLDRRGDDYALSMGSKTYFDAVERGDFPPHLFVAWPQTPHSFEPAIQTLEARLSAGTLVLPPNPLAAWCASNTRVKVDGQGRRQLIKRGSGDQRWKIDPIVALVQALRLSDLEGESGTIEATGWWHDQGGMLSGDA